MPALRERGDDIALLAEHFLKKAAQQENKSFFALSPDAREKLVTHRWPGNVRELENMIRHAVVMHSGDTLTTDMLAVMKTAHPAPVPVKAPPPAKEGILVWNAENEICPMRDVERAVIERALELCDGNITETARRLELNPATIHRKLKAWNGLEVSA
jgi:two-component system repressor protein LuxO